MTFRLDCSRLRQLPLYSKPPPKELTKDQTPEEIAKSQAYGRDKALTSLFTAAYDQALSVALIWFDGFAKVWVLSEKILGPNWSGGVSLLLATAMLPRRG